MIAAAGIRGSVGIVERKSRNLTRTLIGPGLPVWSVIFAPDNHTLITGGTDRAGTEAMKASHVRPRPINTGRLRPAPVPKAAIDSRLAAQVAPVRLANAVIPFEPSREYR